jgi:hypothetical protein
LWENVFQPFFFFPSLHLVLCNCSDRLLVVLVNCFLSLGLILFCGCIGFLVKCVCAISAPVLAVF